MEKSWGPLPSMERPGCLCELVYLCSPPGITRKVAPSSLVHSIHPQLLCERGSRMAKGGLCLHFVFLCIFFLFPAQPPRRPSPLSQRVRCCLEPALCPCGLPSVTAACPPGPPCPTARVWLFRSIHRFAWRWGLQRTQGAGREGGTSGEPWHPCLRWVLTFPPSQRSCGRDGARGQREILRNTSSSQANI